MCCCLFGFCVAFCCLERLGFSLRAFSLNSAGDKTFLSQQSGFPHFDNAKVLKKKDINK